MCLQTAPPAVTRIHPQAQWADAVIHNGTAYFVEVPERGADIVSQTQTLLEQAGRTLGLAGSDMHHLLMATIYLKHMADRTASMPPLRTRAPL